MPAKFGRTEKSGRHVGTRTPDLYRVKNEVIHLAPFSSLVVPHRGTLRNTPKRRSFGDESVTSQFCSPRWRSNQVLAYSRVLFSRVVEVKFPFRTQTYSVLHGGNLLRACALRFLHKKMPKQSGCFLQGNSRKCIHDPF